MNDAEILVRYEEARNNPQLQAELQGDLGYKTYGSVRDRVSNIKKNFLIAPKITESARAHKNSFVKGEGITLKLKAEGVMAVLNDAQIPFHDPITMGLIRPFLKVLQPEYLVYNGDWTDFYQISRFDKNPLRINQLQSDLDEAHNNLAEFRKDLPNTKMILIEGNHEDRLRKWIWRDRPELLSLRCFSLDELLGLIDLEIDKVPRMSQLKINNIFQIEHGEFLSKHSGWTAKAHYERRGGSGIVGHSHRGGVYYKHDDDYFGWWENFCLCDLQPEYVKKPNWMQGFSLVTFIADRFHVEPIPIIKHRFIYGGQMYGGN